MTDLEITKLCAEAMGFEKLYHATDKRIWFIYNGVKGEYDPLHDDAQAMALVKKYGLSISGPTREDPNWYVYETRAEGKIRPGENLNRAIATCVAKMQAVK